MASLFLANLGSPNRYRINTFPSKIVLQGDMLAFFLKNMPYFTVLDQWEGHKPSYTLTADRLFEGDKDTWELFVRLFFPHLIPIERELEVFKLNPATNEYEVNEEIFPQESIDILFDFFLVPRERQYTILRELKDFHKWQAFVTRPAGPVRHIGPYNPNLSLTPDVSDNENENEIYNANNENENEEPNLYNRLTAKNYRRFVGVNPKSKRGKTKKKRGSK